MNDDMPLLGLHAQMHEIFKRVANGTIEPSNVRRGLQQIIEKRFSDDTNQPPVWWRSCDDQLERAQSLWPYREFPSFPGWCSPRMPGEVPLLHVPMPMRRLASLAKDVVEATQRSGAKVHLGLLDDEEVSLVERPNVQMYTNPTWVYINLSTEPHRNPLSLVADAGRGLAGLEILSAMIQFPDWVRSWLQAGVPPVLGGLLANRRSTVSAPFFIPDHGNKAVRLVVAPTDADFSLFAIPGVRPAQAV